jgi:hypothetical protein
MVIVKIISAGRCILATLLLGTLCTACFENDMLLFGDTCAATEQTTLQLSWESNREKAVNSHGGGYKLKISSSQTGDSDIIDVPFQKGKTAPTEKKVAVCSGHVSLDVSIQAYSKLNQDGSDWSEPVTVAVE